MFSFSDFVDVQISVLILIGLSSFFAGFFDAMVGGGGLIQIPSLFGLFPGVNPATLLGTNKVASIVGTANAAYRYLKRVKVSWWLLFWAVKGAFLGAFAGAYLITILPAQILRAFLPFLLVFVAWISFRDKNLGLNQTVVIRTKARNQLTAFMLALTIGFYDGLFGPGTGTFLVLAWVIFFGQDFITASASAKIVNVACNLASICWFAPSGHILWSLAMGMAFMNLCGAQIGALLAIKRGAIFVRKIFMVVVLALIVKTSYDAYQIYWRDCILLSSSDVSRETGLLFSC